MRKIVLFFLIITCMMAHGANDATKHAKQLKTDIATAKAAIKNATDMEKNDNNAKNKLAALEKSEQTMNKYISQKEYSDRIDLYQLRAELLKKQYESGNEKMYLKQKVDTAWYVKTGRRMFFAIEALDSMDALPNEKGEVELSYRKKHSEYLMPYRINIMKGGAYFVSHKEWAEAWQCLDLYLDSRKWPLFENAEKDVVRDKRVAFMSMYVAKELNDYDKIRKYSAEVLADTTRRERALTMLSDMSLAKGDSASYIKYVTEGFEKYSRSEYFFSRLIDYYTGKGDYVSSEKYVDKALKIDSLNSLFLLAKHGVLMAVGKYDNALSYAEKLMHNGDTLPVLNYNVGYIYYVKAQNALKKQGKPYRQRMKEAQTYFRKLLPYMEKYRKIAPNERQKWYSILYDAYLNLNMGKEFKELEKE